MPEGGSSQPMENWEALLWLGDVMSKAKTLLTIGIGGPVICSTYQPVLALMLPSEQVANEFQVPHQVANGSPPHFQAAAKSLRGSMVAACRLHLVVTIATSSIRPFSRAASDSRVTLQSTVFLLLFLFPFLGSIER